MKTKLVLWGTNAQNERVLIALELLPQENKVKAYTFPEQTVSEEFSQQMLQEWRDGKPLEFPEGFQMEEKELSITETILPEGIKAERDDIIQRAQTEWHFVVLSSKLHDAYVKELEELKERVSKLPRFDIALWDELKTFWDKVQNQVREKNLFREHADALRDHTNELFSQLKSLRNRLDEEFERLSKENFERMQNTLEEIERKVKEGVRLQPLFDELKEIQRKFRDVKLTKDHRTKVWDRLDHLFKIVKEKRFGTAPAGDDRSPSERLNRRYEGLISAIEKMERSIKRDEEDLDFQKHKVATTDGQLEAQIRQAKILMIEERIRSKRDKLHEMLQTKEELDRRLVSQKEKDAKREEREQLEKAKRAVQEKIAEEIKAAAAARGEEESVKLTKAAEAIAKEQHPEAATEEAPEEKRQDSLLEAAGITLSETFEDVIDTVKAVAEVVGEHMEEGLEELKEKVEDVIESVQESFEKKEADDDDDDSHPAADPASPEAVAEEPGEEKAEGPEGGDAAAEGKTDEEETV